VVLLKADELVGKWACEPQDKTLAYILKVDPAAAKPLIERAIEARGARSNACRHGLLTEIGALEDSPVLEELAVTSLDDPDPEVAANAVYYLRDYGSADAEDTLWVHYEDWSREWSGRASELRYVPGGKNTHVWAANLGQSLASALASGVGWLSDESKLRRIEALGDGASIQQELDQALQAWSQRPFTITCIGTSPPSFSLAQYNLRSMKALKTKLAEFPRGTKFFLSPPDPTASQEELESVQEIFDFAAKKGFLVTRAPER
jgi:hypothetical protein